ncbi:MAG TPA: VTT domain-containing protein, partial [Caulobacteraceae bacterium]
LAGRHARWFTVSPRELAAAERWFRRWGGPAVCLGRALPGIRGVICIPAGLARMPPLAFGLWSTLGAALWTGLMMAAGYALKARYVEVQHWLNPVADGFLAISLITYLVRVAAYRPRRRRERADS